MSEKPATESLFRTGKHSTSETEAEIKKHTLTLFSLSPAIIDSFFSALQQSEGKFTAASIAETLKVEINQANDYLMVFLHLIHMQREHSISREAAKNELVAAGCDPTKANEFAQRVESLNARALEITDLYYYANYYVDDFEHYSNMTYSLEYLPTSRIEAQGPTSGLLPVIVLKISIEKSDKEEEVSIHFPITRIGFFVKALEEIEDSARNRVKTLKSSMKTELFIPEG